ncbi:MAG: hypothetical protein HKN49_01410, partial [Gammaproteobacteria bacterium]|nr:hypothetical protein [Gammaproteobacteria bacterium]
MMRRRWLVLLSIILLPLVAAAVILFTGPGLRLAWDMTRDLVPGKISAEHISGRLVGPIEIT